MGHFMDSRGERVWRRSLLHRWMRPGWAHLLIALFLGGLSTLSMSAPSSQPSIGQQRLAQPASPQGSTGPGWLPGFGIVLSGDQLDQWEEASRIWLNDRWLQLRVKSVLAAALGQETLIDVDVDVTKGQVILTGTLATWEEVTRAITSVRQIEGVHGVTTRLRAEEAV